MMRWLPFFILAALLLSLPSGYAKAGGAELGAIEGRVFLQSRADHSGVEVRAGDLSTTTRSDGSFRLEVPPGTYRVEAFAAGYLGAEALGVEVRAGETASLPEITLVGGDVDGDEAIDVRDAALISEHFGELEAGAWDINGDGIADVFDLVKVGIHFGELGPLSWAVAELPDLAVAELSGEWVDEGAGTYKVNYVIANRGAADAPAGFDIALFVDGEKVEEQEISADLLPSGEYRGAFQITLSGDEDKIIVFVDCNEEVTESDEVNNTRLVFFPPLSAKFPDLAGAVEHGKKWLAAQQNPDGSWGSRWQVSKTALAILKFEIEAFEKGISPFDPSYPFSRHIRRGYRYIFSHAHVIDIGPQMHGPFVDDPDLDGDGIGVYFLSPVYGHNPTYIYDTSIVAMAIAASNAPGRVIHAPGSPVDGWTFREVLRDAIDYLAWAQTDKGFGRGGWNYEPMDNAGDRSDQSNTGWVTLALACAEAPPPLGFGLRVPGFVKRELAIWVDYIQNKMAGSLDEGGSGYTAPWEWVNILKTGNLLQQLAWLGATPADPRVQKALDYLVRHWNDPDEDPGWRGAPGQPASYHATYTVMKGLDSLHIPRIGGIDWFADLATVILAQQNPDGSWSKSQPDAMGGLGLLTFLAHGETPVSKEFGMTVPGRSANSMTGSSSSRPNGLSSLWREFSFPPQGSRIS